MAGGLHPFHIQCLMMRKSLILAMEPSLISREELRHRPLYLKHFRKQWKLEYLTSLREFHKTTGNNIQRV